MTASIVPFPARKITGFESRACERRTQRLPGREQEGWLPSGAPFLSSREALAVCLIVVAVTVGVWGGIAWAIWQAVR